MKNKDKLMRVELLSILMFSLLISCKTADMNSKKCVQDNQKAIEIAEQKWLSTYGEGIYSKKPFKAKLVDNIWIVEGTLHNSKGGVPYAEINADNCEIIKISHGK
jgi:hypothetical protein